MFNFFILRDDFFLLKKTKIYVSEASKLVSVAEGEKVGPAPFTFVQLRSSIEVFVAWRTGPVGAETSKNLVIEYRGSMRDKTQEK